jgi:hypothetical protein
VGNFCKSSPSVRHPETDIVYVAGIRANPNLGDTGFTSGINSAILRYDGAANTDPTTTQSTSVAPLVETNLHVSPILIS